MLAEGQPTVSKHIRVLENARLIERGRHAQGRPCTLRPESLEEESCKTISTLTLRYESTAVRDAILASPMESGPAAGFARLDELLASLA